MTIIDYLYPSHYLSFPGLLWMLLVAMLVIGLCLWLIVLNVKRRATRFRPETRDLFVRDEVGSLSERFYELIFSNTAILMFVAVYFMIDYFGVGASYRQLWDTYNGVILLVFIMTSIAFTTVMDNLIIPLKNVHPGERAAMRLMGMLYMLVIFAYIKFIYKDNNYDSIIIYFLTLVIGRFVYFDASLENFNSAVKETLSNLSLLLLALLCTAMMALFGFKTGYLIRKNGVVYNLFIAHLFLLIVIFVVHRIGFLKRYGKKMQRRQNRERGQYRRAEQRCRPIPPEREASPDKDTEELIDL